MTALIVIISILAFFLLLALIIGKDLNIEHTITVNKPKQEVFEFIRFVKNHDNFSVWAMMDPDMKKEYRGTDGTVGFVYTWDSAKEKNVGAGEQEIKNIFPGEGIEFEIRFKRPMEDVAKAIMTLEAVTATQTSVKWAFISKMKFPMNLLKPLFRSILGKDLKKGLDNLKSFLEKA